MNAHKTFWEYLRWWFGEALKSHQDDEFRNKFLEFEREAIEEIRRISDDDPENPPEVRKI